MSRTRVGANLLWLVPGVVGGSEEYTVRLLEALHGLTPDGVELVLFVNRSLAATYPELVGAYPTVIAPTRGRVKPLRVTAEATWLARQARAEGVELLHHMGGTMPVVRSVPGMVTVHDLQPFANPEHFTRVKRAYLHTTVPTSVRRAQVVVVPSEFTRRDVVERVGVAAERILIVPPGIDEPAPVAPDLVDLVRERHGLADRPFFLYPAITYPHKNHLTLIRAFAHVAARDPEPMLVLTGGEAQGEFEVRSEIDRRGLADRVVRTGRVPVGDLDALFDAAAALTFPSLYEGFGLPTLEAMSRGVPVIASANTALPEVVGDAGLLVEPLDVAGWSEAMRSLLSDGGCRDDLAARGRIRAARFSWNGSGEALAGAYRAGLDRLREKGTAVNVIVLCPHFSPDVAPTGEVMTSIAGELVRLGHRLHIVTSLPWYQHHALEPGWDGQLVRHETTEWGSITRVHPFPTDKGNLPARAVAFGGFTVLATLEGVLSRLRPDVVLAMSPPLTMGMAGWAVARARRVPFVFNIQDVFPDVAVELGLLTGRRAIAAASWLERVSYRRADAVTVLSDDLADNVRAKVTRGLGSVDADRQAAKVRVIPNFIDTAWIQPGSAENAYRAEHGLVGKRVVMYAGNVGLSQSLDLVLDAAVALRHEPDVAFVINGGGAARPELERRARGIDNLTFVDMAPKARLREVLAAADVHVVPLKRGLAWSSVPSKLYSILAAGRPIVASVDPGTEVARTVERAGAGLAVAPDDPEAFTKAIRRLLDDPSEAVAMGAAGRRFVETWASPAAVAVAYQALFEELRDRRPRARE